MELMPWGGGVDNEEPACYEFLQITAEHDGSMTGLLPDSRGEQGPWNGERMHVFHCISGFNRPSRVQTLHPPVLNDP